MSDTTLTRRDFLAAAIRTAGIAGLAALIVPRLASALALPPSLAITVYKDPSCGCCVKWVSHLSANGFAPVVHDRMDMDALKVSLGVPAALRSCHTAVMGKYLIEGHVPAADIKQLRTSAPADVRGLAAPGMPVNSPGMEMPGQRDRYDVIAFGRNGTTRVFASHA